MNWSNEDVVAMAAFLGAAVSIGHVAAALWRSWSHRDQLRVSCSLSMNHMPRRRFHRSSVEDLSRDHIPAGVALEWCITNAGRRPTTISSVGGTHEGEEILIELVGTTLEPTRPVRLTTPQYGFVPRLAAFSDLWVQDSLGKRHRVSKKQIRAIKESAAWHERNRIVTDPATGDVSVESVEPPA